jgi:RNA polymerase sigma-70 factor (ECF subfamily)
LVANRHEAEDVCQEVFLRMYKARKGYRARARFSTWLFTIANNTALNYLRRKGRNTSVPISSCSIGSQSGASPVLQIVGREGTPSAKMRRAELGELVRESLTVLSEEQKVAVLLRKFEEMSYAEIADVMGRSPAAVKSLLARARNQLRERLEPYIFTGHLGIPGR